MTDKTDIVDRLREDPCFEGCFEPGDTADLVLEVHAIGVEAADEIERLRTALKDCLDDMEDTRVSGDAGFWDWREGGVYMRGRAALNGKEG